MVDRAAGRPGMVPFEPTSNVAGDSGVVPIGIAEASEDIDDARIIGHGDDAQQDLRQSAFVRVADFGETAFAMLRARERPAKPSEGWLAALDDFRNWLIREAA